MKTTTKHNCPTNGFPHKTPGCPRCDELLAGHAPRPSWQQRAAGIRPRSMHTMVADLVDEYTAKDVVAAEVVSDTKKEEIKIEMVATKRQYHQLALSLEGLKSILKNKEKSNYSNVKIYKTLQATETKIAQIVNQYNTLKNSI